MNFSDGLEANQSSLKNLHDSVRFLGTAPQIGLFRHGSPRQISMIVSFRVCGVFKHKLACTE